MAGQSTRPSRPEAIQSAAAPAWRLPLLGDQPAPLGLAGDQLRRGQLLDRDCSAASDCPGRTGSSRCSRLTSDDVGLVAAPWISELTR